jgi:hypothetical protein
MKNLPETDTGPTVPMEQGNELARRRREELHVPTASRSGDFGIAN